MYYNKEGDEITLDAWAVLFEDHDYRIVKKTKRGRVEVSTVFMGLDHAIFGGPPIIFETMVFGGKFNQRQERYSTLEQAQEGHEAICEIVFKKRWWQRKENS